jgi:lambda repressor-like predicted transcriptional regulator
MGSRITEIEKLTFLGLHKSGMSIREISRRTGRSTDSIKQFTTDDVASSAFDQRSILNDEDMYKIFDLYSAGKRVTDIARQMNQPSSTVGMVTRRLYPKHQKAYAKWLELQKEKDAPALVMEVQPVEEPTLPAALLAIRAARAAGRTSQPATVEQVQPECVDFRSKYFALLEEHSRVMADYIKSLKAL